MTALLSVPPARTRTAVACGVVLLTGVSWSYLFLLSARMGDMGSPFAMPMTSAWTGHDVVLMTTMWAVMMAAMMLPSAAPMISAYATTVKGKPGQPRGSTAVFVAGYLVTWSGFAVAATAAQWALHDAALVNAMGVSTSGSASGGRTARRSR